MQKLSGTPNAHVLGRSSRQTSSDKVFLLSLGNSSVYISKGELTQPLRKNSEEKGHVLAFGKSHIWPHLWKEPHLASPQSLTLLSHRAQSRSLSSSYT